MDPVRRIIPDRLGPKVNGGWDEGEKRWRRVTEVKHVFVEMNFDVPEAHWPYLLDWSYSNLCLCYDIGLKSGENWLKKKVEKPIEPQQRVGQDKKNGRTSRKPTCRPSGGRA